MSLKGHCETFVTEPIIVAVNAYTNVSTSNVVLQDRSVLVAWRSSDLDRFTPRSAPVLTSTIAATTTNSSSVGNKTGDGTHNRLSTGAKAGIGVGVALACITVATVILFLLRRKRRKTEVASRAEIEGTPVVQSHAHSKAAEADSTPRAELEGG